MAERKEQVIMIIKKLKSISELDESMGLIDSGFFDSFDVINLITKIEQDMGIKIPGEEILPHNLSSIANIVKLLERLENV